ncbi:hypothetical protein JHK84_052524 [Glycine max]|nr:hypothetical protein JHK84_052524 [Glycine max]
MNIVPVAAKVNTLGAIYKRGLIGTYMKCVDAWESLLNTNKLVCGFCLIDRVIALDPSTSISRIFAASYQLGIASCYNTKVYCRQTLIGGNYGLLNTTTFALNPDYYRHFSSETQTDKIASSLSSELLKEPDSDALSVSQCLNLSFSHITPTPNLILQTLNLSPQAGCTILGFHQWQQVGVATAS